LTLSGSNTYTGTTTVSAGTLSIGSTGGLGNGSNNTASVAVATSAILDFNFNGTLLNNASGFTLGLTGSGAITGSNGTGSTLGTNVAVTLGQQAALVVAEFSPSMV